MLTSKVMSKSVAVTPTVPLLYHKGYHSHSTAREGYNLRNHNILAVPSILEPG